MHSPIMFFISFPHVRVAGTQAPRAAGTVQRGLAQRAAGGQQVLLLAGQKPQAALALFITGGQ